MPCSKADMLLVYQLMFVTPPQPAGLAERLRQRCGEKRQHWLEKRQSHFPHSIIWQEPPGLTRNQAWFPPRLYVLPGNMLCFLEDFCSFTETGMCI